MAKISQFLQFPIEGNFEGFASEFFYARHVQAKYVIGHLLNPPYPHIVTEL